MSDSGGLFLIMILVGIVGIFVLALYAIVIIFLIAIVVAGVYGYIRTTINYIKAFRSVMKERRALLKAPEDLEDVFGAVELEPTAAKMPRIHQMSAYFSWGIVVVNESGTIDVYGEIGYSKWKKCWKKGLADWTDITEVSSSSAHTVGLKNNGSVVAFTGNPYKVVYEKQADIDAACEVGAWNDIVQVACGRFHTVGLKNDGTVVAVGNNDSGQCLVQNWRDIVQISAENHYTAGLMSDGRLVMAGGSVFDSIVLGKTAKWNGLLGIALINTRADTFVIAIDRNYKIISTLSKIEELCQDWENIVKIYTHNNSVIGVQNNGRVLYKSVGEPPYGGDKLADLYRKKR